MTKASSFGGVPSAIMARPVFKGPSVSKTGQLCHIRGFMYLQIMWLYVEGSILNLQFDIHFIVIVSSYIYEITAESESCLSFEMYQL